MAKTRYPGMFARLIAAITATVTVKDQGVIPTLQAQSFCADTLSRRKNKRRGVISTAAHKHNAGKSGNKLRKLIRKERLALTNPGGTISAYYRYTKAARMQTAGAS